MAESITGHKYTPTKYCRHYSCQCDQALELAYMSDLLNRVDLLAKAVDVHKFNKEVRCRHKPRPDSLDRFTDVPLPPLPEDKQA